MCENDGLNRCRARKVALVERLRLNAIGEKIWMRNITRSVIDIRFKKLKSAMETIESS